MALRWFIRPNAYYDSVKLMRVSEALTSQPGVTRAAAVMATPLNVDLLRDDGLLPPDIHPSPDDLLVAVLAEEEAAAEETLRRVDELLAVRAVEQDGAYRAPPRTLERAARDGANLAVIAVPGQFAAAEAYTALRAGMHVFLFSDNVPLEEEVRLKTLAEELDLLMMGPDCGTAILDGLGLGFANRVQRGPVGIVGASGTGIQQLCTLLDASGIGIAQAIGTGGRDLSSAVGGSMTRRAIRLLADDPEVQLIAVISKPGDAVALQRLHDDLAALAKPVVACLLGDAPEEPGKVCYAQTLADAARAIVGMLSGEQVRAWTPELPPIEQRRGKRVYGLFAGGTLCAEAARVLDGMEVEHDLIDLGDDRYTRGRAHPIIDGRLRLSMLADLRDRADIAAVLVDVILGDLAHPDPAADLAPILATLGIPSVVTLVGTRADPQGLERQRAALAGAGAQVFDANAEAARTAGMLAGEGA